MGDLILWLLFEVFFGYVFYITGATILRMVTLGKSRVELYSLRSYKNRKNLKIRTPSQAYLVGLLFYVVLTVLLVLFY